MRRSLALSLAVLLLSGALVADDARIRQLTATAREGTVGVAFVLDRAFDHPDIATALESGLPTGFTYHVQLVRKRPNWFDDTLQTALIEVICTYNSVTREYLLNTRRDRRLVRSEVFNDLTALKRAMSTISEDRLFAIGRRKPQKLVVRARADVMQGYFLYVMPWEVSTDWATTRVKSGNGRTAKR